MPPRPRAPLADVQANSNLVQSKFAEPHNAKKNNDAEKPASRKRKSDTDSATNEADPKKSRTAKSGTTVDKTQVPDVSGIQLLGEDTASVEVYDTCEMLRSKIKLFMKQHPKESNASLARRIGTPATGLARFCEKKGADKGNTSEAFYRGYIYFEKLRLAQNKAKSKDRLSMEEIWGPEGGFNIKTASNNRGVWVMKGESVRMDKYGKFKISG